MQLTEVVKTRDGGLVKIFTDFHVNAELLLTKEVRLLSENQSASAARQTLEDLGHYDIRHHAYSAKLVSKDDRGVTMNIAVYDIIKDKD